MSSRNPRRKGSLNGSHNPFGKGSHVYAREVPQTPNPIPPLPSPTPIEATNGAAPAVVEEELQIREPPPTNGHGPRIDVEGILLAAATELAGQDLRRRQAEGESIRSETAWLKAAIRPRREQAEQARAQVARGELRTPREVVMAMGGDDPNDPDGSKKAAMSAAWARS